MLWWPLFELPPEIDPDVVRPGGGALLLVLGLGVIVALLCWSMMRHMRKVREHFADEIVDVQPFEQDGDDDASPAAGSGSTPAGSLPSTSGTLPQQ